MECVKNLKVFRKLSAQNRTVLVNMIGAFGVKGFSLCLSLFTMPAYIRYFNDQTILGVWYTIVSVLSWITFFDLGLGNGLRNILPAAIADNNKKKIQECISTTYYITIGLVVFLFGVSLILIPNLNWNVLLNVSETVVDPHTLMTSVKILLWGIFLQFIFKLVSSVLYALQKSAVVDFMMLCTSVLTLLAIYIMPSTTLQENLWRMAYANVFAAIVPYLAASFWVYGRLLKGCFPRYRYCNKLYISPLLKMGVSLLWLQLIFMVISSTNEFLISAFTEPKFVVEYQAYNKVFKTGSMVFSLALTPIWSAVTKAQANKDYYWIIKIYKIFLIATLGCIGLEFLIIPFLQVFMDIWLGQGIIEITMSYAIVFLLSSSIFVLHNVNTSIGNGISYFKVQMILMTMAAIIFIPLAWLCVRITSSWIGVIVAQVLALLPYEILAPYFTIKKLEHERKKQVR